jgi:CheY-like chemotaxis protein
MTIPRRTDGCPRVLLVDDVRARRYALAQLLRSDGCDVQSASGHESWLSLFTSCLTEPAAWVSFVAAVDPDLVLIEIDQPTALATIGAIRQHPLTDQVPIVALGDPVHQRSLQAALGLGAVRWIHRPLALSGLRGTIDAIVSSTPPRHVRTGDELPSIVLH